MPAKKNLIKEISATRSIKTYVPAAALVALYNDDFTITEANESYFKLTGYTKKETFEHFQNSGLKTIHPDDIQLAIFSLKQQIEHSKKDFFNVVARLVSKKNAYNTIHFSGVLFTDTDNVQKIFFLLVDISSQVKLFEGLEREKRFNSLVDRLTDDSFFEYTAETKEIRFSKHFAEKFAIEETTENYPKSLIKSGVIAKNFIDFEKIAKGNQQNTDDIHFAELAFIAPNKVEYWYDAFYKIEKDENNKLIRVVGKMNDNTANREKIDQLREKAEKDHLTGLYNKVTTEHLIETKLRASKKNDKSALMIIDVDNFKSVNDKLGHLFGDIVLAQLAENLSQFFRSGDIIGRIGGDEFFVFIPQLASIDLIKSKAEKICEAFKKTFHEADIYVDISASIGIAIAPDHGKEFEALYKNADIALYSAKEKGKNRFEFFEGQIQPTYQGTRTEIETQESVKASFKSNTVEYIFKLLFASEYAYDALKSTLGLIIEHFRFSSGYIGEIDENGLYLVNSFSYNIDDSIDAQPKEKIYHKINSTDLAKFQDITTEGKIYDSRNHNIYSAEIKEYFKSRDIKSLLLYPIIKDKAILGYVIFENRHEESDLNGAEIIELSTICNILATFYIKDFLIKQAKERENLLAELINNLDGYSYIIDKKDYTILYETPSLETTFGGSNIGKICHEVYTGSHEPCKHCFIPHLTDDNPQFKRLNMTEAIGMGQVVKASMHNWTRNQKACLVNCVDISEFFDVDEENKV